MSYRVKGDRVLFISAERGGAEEEIPTALIDFDASSVDVARAHGVEALIAGQVESGPKELLIDPLNIRFGNDDLQLR